MRVDRVTGAFLIKAWGFGWAPSALSGPRRQNQATMQTNVFWRALFGLFVTAALGTSSIALDAAGVSNPAGIDWVPLSGFSLARTEPISGS